VKATKFIVGGAAVVGIGACFLDWASIELGGAAKKMAVEFPTSGMDNGGPVFIFFFALPLIAALVGVLKRMGRGMGVLAAIGGLLAAFLGLVKYADISDAGAKLADAGMGQVAVAPGYWAMFFASLLCLLAGLVALIKPEPKPEKAAPLAPPVYQAPNAAM
jgi:hypothetical protein